MGTEGGVGGVVGEADAEVLLVLLAGDGEDDGGGVKAVRRLPAAVPHHHDV